MPHIVKFLFVFLFLLFSSEILLKAPLIWPDEAIYADVAVNIIKENRLGTDLWQGVIPEIENHAYWYPPVFFYLLAFWFKVTHISILDQRLLSLIIGSGFIIIYFYFNKSLIAAINGISHKRDGLFKDKNMHFSWFSTLSVCALMTDFLLLRATRISRPEILVLFFGILALFLFLKVKNIEEIKGRYQSSLLIFSGVFASLAFLTHTIGSLFFFAINLYLIFCYKSRLLKSRYFYLFQISFLLPILVWLISILPSLEILIQQFLLAAERKGMDEIWLVSLFQTQPLTVKIIYLCYLIISISFVILAFVKKRKEYIFLAVILTCTWVFSIYGKMFWYFVFPIPFIYTAASILIYKALSYWKNKKSSYSAQILVIFIAITITLILSNLKLHANTIPSLIGVNFSYDKYTEKIIELIPTGKTVFLSSIPDPYFALKSRGQNKMYEFPVLRTDRDNYLKILNNSDYIIYNGSYESTLFGSFLLSYINKNQAEVIKIGEPLQYQTYIIKLKPQKERTQ